MAEERDTRRAEAKKPALSVRTKTVSGAHETVVYNKNYLL